MRVLLIGEFSRLHNSLKEGLESYGHKVVLAGNKGVIINFPVDVNIDNRIFKYKLPNFVKLVFYKIFKIDISAIEKIIIFLWHLNKFKNFDVVQLIQETAIRTPPRIEIFLLKKFLKYNKKLFLLSCGEDSVNVEFLLNGNLKYSLFTPLINNMEDKEIAKSYKHSFRYFTKNYAKLISFLHKNVRGIIASDFDYVLPMNDHPKFLGLIPNPINTDKIGYSPFEIAYKIKIFLGINKSTYVRKGIIFFERALAIINEKYPDLVEIIITNTLPYNEYIEIYNDCHILLDQVYAYDQGYNALEAMAKGKVVFTGAEQEFLDYYNLEKNEVCINALPSVESIVEELEYLILNPKKIEKISKNARKFIEKEHHYVKIAQKYLDVWNSN